MRLDKNRIEKISSAIKELMYPTPRKPSEPDNSNAPRDIPEGQANRDDIDTDYPEIVKKDPGFTSKELVSGTGSGPILCDESGGFQR
jgi:hypothetical protein